jgi:RNA polymerase primary sigma factor
MKSLIEAYHKNKKLLSQKEIEDIYPLAVEGNSVAIEKLFWASCGLILKLAAKHTKGSSSCTFEEFISSGYLGFLQGIKTGGFNANKGSWSTYIYYYIDGHMRFEKLNTTVIHFPYYLKGKAPYKVENLDSLESPVFLVIEEEEERYPYKKELIDKAFKTLPKREQFIIKELFLKQKTLAEVGKKLGISRERVRQIKEEALKKVKKLLPS